jgi:hypothetical protein
MAILIEAVLKATGLDFLTHFQKEIHLRSQKEILKPKDLKTAILTGFVKATGWRFQMEILRLTAKGLGFQMGIRSGFLKPKGLSLAILTDFLMPTRLRLAWRD